MTRALLCCTLAFAACASKASGPALDDPSTSTATKTTPSSPPPKPEGHDPAPASYDAIVLIKDGKFAPTDVGAWVCERKSTKDPRRVQLHCTAAAGTGGLAEALAADEGVASVESVSR